MKILFVHQNFPSQYKHILQELSQEGHELVALGYFPLSEDVPPNLHYIRYPIKQESTRGIHPLVIDLETKAIKAEACAITAYQLKKQGFHPDLICGHAGWGETLFLKDIWPQTPQLTYQEVFYQPQGFDSHFDLELQPQASWKSSARLHFKSANSFLSLERSEWNQTPTNFQRSSFPIHWQQRISVIHEGIDTEIIKPKEHHEPLQLGDALVTGKTPLVTFVNRRLEPYRGCHTMIRAIPEIQSKAPTAHIVLIGHTEGTSYGQKCPEGEWKDYFLKEIEGNYDPSKVHFTGALPFHHYLELLQRSWAHVYLTYPFVLGWSMLEAMSCGCTLIGSNTAPVQEVIEHRKNGLLVDFFDPLALARSVASMLQDRDQAMDLGSKARETIMNRFERKSCVRDHIRLIHQVAKGSFDQ